MYTELDENEYGQIWSAPNGNEYAIQIRAVGDREWVTSEFAISKITALNWLASMIDHGRFGTEYRVVKLSRYPPCSVTEVVKYITRD